MPALRSSQKQIAAVPHSQLPLTDVAGRTLSYRRSGNPAKQRVIFIHGSPGDWEAWADYLADPVGDFDLIAVDRLGYGESVSGLDEKEKPLKTAVLPYEEQARSIEPLLVQQDGKWPILVGHSLGGPIAARIAADQPSHVGGLLILAGSLDPEFEKPRWYTSFFSHKITNWWIPGDMRQANREMLVTLQETTGLEAELEKITCPVIVVHGVKDDLVPYGNLAYMKKRITNASKSTFISVPEQGHFLPWEREKLVRECILRLGE